MGRILSQMWLIASGCIGYALRRATVLEPLVDLELPIKAIDHTLAEKLVTRYQLWYSC